GHPPQRPAEELAYDPEAEGPVDLRAARVQHPESARARPPAEPPHQARLADPGRAFDQQSGALVGSPIAEILDRRQLFLALEELGGGVPIGEIGVVHPAKLFGPTTLRNDLRPRRIAPHGTESRQSGVDRPGNLLSDRDVRRGWDGRGGLAAGRPMATQRILP